MVRDKELKLEDGESSLTQCGGLKIFVRMFPTLDQVELGVHSSVAKVELFMWHMLNS